MTKNLIIAALVAVIAGGGALAAFAGPPAQTVETEAIVEVTVWQRVSNGELYLSTRPEGGDWATHQGPLDMSALSRSGNFRQGSPVTVVVPVTVEAVADDHGDSFDTATPVVARVTSGEREHRDDVDVFVLQVEGGRTYEVYVRAGTEDDPSVTIYNADEDYLDSDDDGGDDWDARVFWDATYSGPLYIEVGGYSFGTYSLIITEMVVVER